MTKKEQASQLCQMSSYLWQKHNANAFSYIFWQRFGKGIYLLVVPEGTGLTPVLEPPVFSLLYLIA